MSGVLTLMIALPLLAALACLVATSSQAKWLALAATLANLVLGITLWANFDAGGPQWQSFLHRVAGLGAALGR